MLRTGTPSVNDQASYPSDIGELGRENRTRYQRKTDSVSVDA